MTGVEVLSVQNVTTGYVYNWTAYAIAFIVIFVVSTGIAVLIYGKRPEDIIVSMILGCIVAAFFAMLPTQVVSSKKYETQYKVVVSDEVPMNEFLSKYEIISQEGRIYTVRSLEEVHD